MNGKGTIYLYSRSGEEVRAITKVESVRIVDDHLRIRYLEEKTKKMVILDTNMDYVFEYYE